MGLAFKKFMDPSVSFLSLIILLFGHVEYNLLNSKQVQKNVASHGTLNRYNCKVIRLEEIEISISGKEIRVEVCQLW